MRYTDFPIMSYDVLRFEVHSFCRNPNQGFVTNPQVLHFPGAQAPFDDLVASELLEVQRILCGAATLELSQKGDLAQREAQTQGTSIIALKPPSPGPEQLTPHNYGPTQMRIGDSNRLTLHRDPDSSMLSESEARLGTQLESLPASLSNEGLVLLEAARPARQNQSSFRYKRALASLKELVKRHSKDLSAPAEFAQPEHL